MKHFHPLTLVSALAFALPAFADDTRTVWRVFIGDHEAPTITAFDLDTPDTRWTFDTKGQSKLYPAAGGSTIIAVQSDDDQVNLLNSGVSLATHGDHSDLSVQEPSAIPETLTGPRPFHVVAHGSFTAINFDKGGYAAFLANSALRDGKVEMTRFPQARAHHGFAVEFGDVILSSVASDAPVEGDAAPARVGLQAFNRNGDAVGDLATCTGIHGEAFSGAYLAAGCDEGVLTVKEGAEGPEYAMLPYPDDLPDGKTGTLLGARSMQAFLGNYGADGLVMIDPAEEPHFTFVALPFRRVDFVMDPVKMQFAYVLTEDGTLHRVNLLKGEIEASNRATGPYSMDGHWNDPRPRLSVAGDHVLVTDPNESTLHIIAADTLEETQSVPVEGKPYNIAVVGGSGMTH
ncbi:metallochaperone AztD [Falsirhodobacter deserti]|uniref:metallochaperone AztD n=1 Tax=Falsirhodobacter deserti TaxID=1365611 RepID=UPI000FE3C813|nr:metallochaperone AztD [Falsirhodobacter deserti]